MLPSPFFPESMGSHLTFEASAIPLQQSYRLLTHAVAPRPIALVSTRSAAGIGNLAPFSFFMAGGANPPSVAISPTTGRRGAPKDTLRNIAETGEFVINVVDWEMREAVNQTSFPYEYGDSEWPRTPFTPGPCVQVQPARVLQSPMALECKVFSIIAHGVDHGAANYVIAEVVQFHVADRVLNEAGEVDESRMDYISRIGRDWYVRAIPDALFELHRPDSVDAKWRNS